MPQKIIPSLWFDHTAREAVDFYLRAFPDAEEITVTRYPHEGLLDFQQEFAGQELEITFRLGDMTFSAINAGPEFAINHSISMMLHFDPRTDADARRHLDELWAALGEGGTALMELDSYDFSAHYGWLRDRYGMTWQLILSNPDSEPRPFITPSLMFPHNKAQGHEAIELYTSLFENSRVGTVAPYPPEAEMADGSIMYSDFQLAGQWFVIMDAGGPQECTFNEGVSLVVNCADQAEIDRLWDALSAVPEAEQCGWCKDRFGVSWQIVPQNMDELMAIPHSYEALLRMHKIVIADFRAGGADTAQ
ncbi:Glyoxalase superfamily enzyme, possibly 3-demethylubiquinone-9 3-methyltransferase [Propionibacterium cyclohexanicum]|mgnify:CR=1 FL=1|uniref:Glyoxalase superfamily enzyme, possibly 3-demethylubiquinone-9 3-methyltransferase n=1 Tax=Propionibacterium cyclohexanicum TaxID=64702 RepID=A0A1H9REY7_9ACTN|nr:VOC family protein [Propionibacterium cyclohexanicum]SER71391.1 Glyoxalase superfamily enzyme, possibly 3-demethylubiquinone-9 3-methyltransferase [Propionibacterium cyclohexanicum]